MSETQTTPTGPSEDVDLGQFFSLIRNGIRAVFRSVLCVYVYIRKHFIWLAGLVILGLAAGFGLQRSLPSQLAIEAIVSPNLESRNYLTEVVQEIQANLKSNNRDFMAYLGVEADDIQGFSVELEPAVATEATKTNQDIKYLQMLQNFDSGVNVADIVRAELMDKTSLDYRITFLFRDSESGPVVAQKIMEYINSNNYYNDLVSTFRENANSRILFNDSLIRQTDLLIENYRKRMLSDQPLETSRLVLDGEQDVDISELLDLKKELMRDTELRKMDLAKVQAGVTVLNFGKPHPARKTFLGNWMILMPVLLVAAFLLISLLRYMNNKAREYNL